jgi:hypothetical protein
MEISLANTALAVAKQTEGAKSLTTTPSLVPTQTLTPTPQISTSGSALVNLTDGSTQFIDYRAGVQLEFPSIWLAVRVGEAEYYQAWEREPAKNPQVFDILTTLQNLDPNKFRVTAIDIGSEGIRYKNVSKIDVVVAPDDARTLYAVKITETEKKLPLSKFKLLSSGFSKTSDGIETAVLTFQWESVSSTKETFMTYHKEVIFKVPSGTVAIQLFTTLELKDVLTPEFDEIVGSLVLFEPE